MKAINGLFYIIGLILPVLIFVLFIPLGNEKYPAAVWLTCIATMSFAGYMSSRGGGKNAWQWIVFSIAIGLAEALLLTKVI
jgi:VIT1/CCC1 family predicted Fe2+/Mn2+ transporter